MSELTSRSRNGVILLVVLLTCLMLGFHYETIIKGIYPEYSFEPTDDYKQCRPVGFKEYYRSYNQLQ